QMKVPLQCKAQMEIGDYSRSPGARYVRFPDLPQTISSLAGHPMENPCLRSRVESDRTSIGLIRFRGKKNFGKPLEQIWPLWAGQFPPVVFPATAQPMRIFMHEPCRRPIWCRG